MRSRMVSLTRRWLEDRGFVEVETPIFHRIPSGGHALPFVTHHNALDMDLFLRIAPELYLKRLVVGGFEKVFEIGRVFRNEGLSTRHNPEFTMLELYEAYAAYEDLMDLTEEMLGGLVRELTGETAVDYGGQRIDLARPWPRRTMAELVSEHAGIPTAAALDRDVLARCAAERGIDVLPGAAAGHLLGAIFEHVVEPLLVQPTFVC